MWEIMYIREIELSQELDRIDRKILHALQNNARIPFTDISQELGVSDATIHIRVRKMVKAGIIKKYTVVVNERFLGRNVSGYMLIKARTDAIEAVTRRLMEIEKIMLVQELHGLNDILVKIGAMNLETLRDLIRKVQSIPDIEKTEYFTILKTWKE